MSAEIFHQTGNVFIKAILFDFAAGRRTAVSHAHKHSHVTLLAYGELKVRVDGVEVLYRAPAFIQIKAGAHHELTALVDKTVAYCVHDTQGLEVEDLGTPYAP